MSSVAHPPELSRRYPESGPRTLGYAFLGALLAEAVILTAFAWQQHWLAHPASPTAGDDRFLEAQIYEAPPEAKLTAPAPAIPKAPEATISKTPGKGRQAKPHEKTADTENRTETPSGPDLGATHGPVPVFNPAPVLPSYLQSQELNTAVVIEFQITGQGVVTPRLLTSSGNDELDAIAISTARRWKFRPAEQDHKPVDTKIRLRILFEVH